MTNFPVVYHQRFWPIRLNELIDYQSYLVQEFIKDCKTPRELADEVIRKIAYPFHGGKPDDLHIYNSFHGRFCRKIESDYWAKASECLAALIGDCEDSTITFVACARAMGVKPEDVYVVFGYVRNARTGEIVGGHAWAVIIHESFGAGWRYIETTLDVPPGDYPVVDDIRKPFAWGSWVLVPEILWNDSYYEEIQLTRRLMAEVAVFLFKKRKSQIVKHSNYLDLKFSEKETRKKYEALSEMWGITTKPLKKAGLLSKIRWRS